MIFLDEIRYNYLYKKPFHLPIDDTDKKHNSVIYLLTPDINSSIDLMNNKFFINNKYFESYFINKDVSYIINNGFINETSEYSVLDESSEVYSEEKPINTFIGLPEKDIISNEYSLRFTTENKQELVLLFNNDNLLLEGNTKYNPVLKRLLYNERYKNNKEIFELYDVIKANCKDIKYSFIDIDKYHSRNIFIDLFNYNKLFLKNNIWKLDKGLDLYLDLLARLLDSAILEKHGYEKFTVFVPIESWASTVNNIDDLFDYKKSINPISMITRFIKMHPDKLLFLKDIDFIFIGKNGYFKCKPSTLDKKTYHLFLNCVNKLVSNSIIQDDNPNIESTKSIKANVVSKIENLGKLNLDKSSNSLVNNKTSSNNIKNTSEPLSDKNSEDNNLSNTEIIDKKIDYAASSSKDTQETMDKLNDDEEFKQLLADLYADEGEVKVSQARASRIVDLQNEFLKEKIKDSTIEDILNDKVEEIEETSLEVDSVNEEWNHMTYMNFEKSYNLQADILAALYSLSEKSRPIAIRDISVENTSTSEDLKETYTVAMEDISGSRFTIKVDIPIIKDNKFMFLRGNDKTINGQLTSMPIMKTNSNSVQIASNYKKMFIRRFGTSSGKSMPSTDILIKTIKKNPDIFKIVYGDNHKISDKYEVPIDYYDLSNYFNTIESKNNLFIFNLDTMIDKYNADLSQGIPVGIVKKTKEVIYITNYVVSSLILDILMYDSEEFASAVSKSNFSSKYTYSKVAVLSRNIPLVIIMAYHVGLIKAMEKAHIKFELIEKRPSKDIYFDYIKFKDGYVKYSIDYNSSLLMNGLKEAPTENYSIKDINSKHMYMDFLELYGPRVVSDGLENFYDLMIDPITKEVLEYYKLPTDYIDLLAYANLLLADNKFNKHTNMNGRRYRSMELIAGYFYQALAEAYGAYTIEYKRRGKATLSLKQSIVIDKILSDPTCSDLSILNDLLNIESGNTVGYKGLVGLNSDRAYGQDKRSYDDSMLNVCGLGTSFSGNVGVTRQATVDANIEGSRGYIKTIDNDTDKLSVTKSFTMTESVTAFNANHDDPMRSAMNQIQTSKHQLRTKKSMPMLISNGADQAMPYISPDTFAFKSKNNGKVVEVTEDYMIIQYVDGTNEFVDLRNTIKKNSNGGFYIDVKLDTDLKVGNKVKKGQVVAHDKLSYSSKVSDSDTLAYNIGTLVKVAALNSDEGFEDSCIISEYLSDCLTSDVVVQKNKHLEKNTNILFMVKKGQPIQEGDNLLVFQNAFEDEDVNTLLKTLSKDNNEEDISDLGRISIKSKVTGIVDDIKIYRTCEKSELSPSLKKIVNEYEKPIKNLKSVMEKYDIDSSNKLEADYKLDQVGKVKNIHDGILIEFYLRYSDKFSVGDKLVFNTACKGVAKEIFTEGKEPYTDFRKNEEISAILGQGAILGRMVPSIIIAGSINKGLIELDRAVKEIAGIEWKPITELE